MTTSESKNKLHTQAMYLKERDGVRFACRECGHYRTIQYGHRVNKAKFINHDLWFLFFKYPCPTCYKDIYLWMRKKDYALWKGKRKGRLWR